MKRKKQLRKNLRRKKGKNSFYEKGESLTDQEYSNHSQNIIKKFTCMQKSFKIFVIVPCISWIVVKKLNSPDSYVLYEH